MTNEEQHRILQQKFDLASKKYLEIDKQARNIIANNLGDMRAIPGLEAAYIEWKTALIPYAHFKQYMIGRQLKDEYKPDEKRYSF